MDASTLVLITVVALTVWLASFVYLKYPSRWVNRAFSIFTLAVAGWTAGTWAGNYFADTQVGLALADVAGKLGVEAFVVKGPGALGGVVPYGVLSLECPRRDVPEQVRTVAVPDYILVVLLPVIGRARP